MTAAGETYLPHFKKALELAAQGRYRTSPNPMVGAVVLQGQEVVGTGYHRRVGGEHAEVEALRQAAERAVGATLVVTLEPCCHHGRTPPCADEVIAAGIRRVLACHPDPDTRVRGQGLDRLRQAQIEVATGFMVEEAVRLNLHYLVNKVHHRPAVTLKWAMSADGRIATATGESQWISSPPGREWALELREEHDAILVGIGTALADDPSLNRRLGLAEGPNQRVVLDRRLRLSPRARLFEIPGPVVIYTESPDADRRYALEQRGATVVVLPRVEPRLVVEDLFQRGVHSLLVEGGGEVLASFAAAGVFDRVRLLVAPLLIGGRQAPGPLGGDGTASLAEAPRLDHVDLERRGQDVVLTGYRQRCLEHLVHTVSESSQTP